MIQRGQYLPFVPEATQYERAVQAVPHEFDGHAVLEFAVGTPRFVDGTHAAASDFARDSIRPDTPPNHSLFGATVRRFSLHGTG
jgi:hypothetical protein